MCLDNFEDIKCVLIRRRSESRVKPSNKIQKFFEENDIPYDVRYIENYSLSEFTELIKLTLVNFYEEEEKCLTIQKLLFPALEKNNIIIKNCEDNLMEKLYEQRMYMKLPIVLKGDIGVIGYTRIEEYGQFIVGDKRDNSKSLLFGYKMPKTIDDTIDWMEKNYAPPKKVKNCTYFRKGTKLYFPSTNVIYGGKITWEYPNNIIDDDGYVVKYKDKFDIKMTIELNNISKEFNYTVRMDKVVYRSAVPKGKHETYRSVSI